MESKLRELADVLPDLSTRLDNMKVDLVVQLISDIQVRKYTIICQRALCLLFMTHLAGYLQSLQAVAQKLVDLRGVMPDINVSSLLAKHPVLLLQLNPEKVAKQLQELRCVHVQFATADDSLWWPLGC